MKKSHSQSVGGVGVVVVMVVDLPFVPVMDVSCASLSCIVARAVENEKFNSWGVGGVVMEIAGQHGC